MYLRYTHARARGARMMTGRTGEDGVDVGAVQPQGRRDGDNNKQAGGKRMYGLYSPALQIGMLNNKRSGRREAPRLRKKGRYG